MSKRRRPAADSPERTAPPFPGRPRPRWLAKLDAFHLRDSWWRLLDAWEEKRWVRATAWSLAAGAVIVTALALWVYPWWARRNAIKVAREWLEAGQLVYAAEAAARAATLVPDSPEPWLVAAELARRGGQTDKALEASRRAVELAPDNAEALTALAADLLRADQTAEAARTIDRLAPDLAARSGHALRIRGELARRELRLPAAQGYFEAAARAEGEQAINQVPLGLVLLQSGDAAVRERALAILARWTQHREWGPTALRTLLDDALRRDDRDAMRRWAGALRQHPGLTVGDMPRCLLALAKADEPAYAALLAGLERDHAVSPAAAAQLLDWLNGIGRHADALRWYRTLPAAAQEVPPLAPLAAEALRATGAWAELLARSHAQSWGPGQDFLRWTYALTAARAVGDATQAEEYHRTLYAYAQRSPGQAHFAASALYLWGRESDALDLWWRIAGQDGKAALEALGSLARHFQLRRDADGQYRVFRRLRELQPQNRSVGNNFAFFALLTGREQVTAEQIARDNLAAEPGNDAFLGTQGFALFQRNRGREALALLEPHAAKAARSPALGFAYGLALAANGRKDEARPLLHNLPPETLTLQETELIAELVGVR